MRTHDIRFATAADARALARLRFAFRSAIAPPEEDEATFVARCERWMAERLAGGDGWRAWVAERDGGIVGNVWLHLIEKLPNPVAEPESHGYITNFFVLEHARGAGVGAALLGAALGEGERLQLDAVILWPTPRSRSLYERHGFAVRDDLMERRGTTRRT
ncbi:MAG TPA: GNAT family N-acetyltransferase [Gemmatimonadaceae bacterium]